LVELLEYGWNSFIGALVHDYLVGGIFDNHHGIVHSVNFFWFDIYKDNG